MKPDNNIDTLLEVMARLRDPDDGCPWDVEQDFASIAPYTIEEAYEVADAIRQGDMGELKRELGDLLFQVVFHAQMASEKSLFNFGDVVTSVNTKMIERHPHVFGDTKILDAEAQTSAWEAMKAAERELGGDSKQVSALDDIPLAFPALLRAEKLQKRAARVGFDWPEIAPVFDKIDEEIGEVKEAMAHTDSGCTDKIGEEVGDLLFACVNLARHLNIKPEEALARASAKFERRFRDVEQQAREVGDALTEMDIDALETLWEKAKQKEH